MRFFFNFFVGSLFFLCAQPTLHAKIWLNGELLPEGGKPICTVFQEPQENASTTPQTVHIATQREGDDIRILFEVQPLCMSEYQPFAHTLTRLYRAVKKRGEKVTFVDPNQREKSWEALDMDNLLSRPLHSRDRKQPFNFRRRVVYGNEKIVLNAPGLETEETIVNAPGGIFVTFPREAGKKALFEKLFVVGVPSQDKEGGTYPLIMDGTFGRDEAKLTLYGVTDVLLNPLFMGHHSRIKVGEEWQWRHALAQSTFPTLTHSFNEVIFGDFLNLETKR